MGLNSLHREKRPFWQSILINFGFTLALLSILFAMDIIYAFYDPNYTHLRITGHERTLISFVLVLSLVNSSAIRLFFIFSLFFSSLVQYLHFQYFGNLVQPIAFFMLINNVQEVAESYFDVLSTAIVPLLLVATAFFISVRVNRWFQGKLFSLRFGIVILLLFFCYQINWTYSHLHQKSGRLSNHYAKKIYPMPIAHSATNFQRSFFCFLSGIVPKKFFGSTQNFPILPPPQLKEAAPDRTVVLVIGESLRYDRLSLLGYHSPTTPNLDRLFARKDIYADWIYAGGTVTKTAVSVILNRLKYPGVTAQISTQTNNMFKLAKDNGFKTYFFSAQEESKLRILDNLICKNCIDHYENRTDYEEENPRASKYDDILLSLVAGVDWDKPAFIVFQQRGSHSPYAKQVPLQFKKFTDDYDNTVLYTDTVLTSLLSHIRKKSKNSLYYMYVSDHGELLGENGTNGHGWFEKEVYEVPFIYYADDRNREKYADQLLQVRSQFDVSNLVATLLGYRVKWDSPDEDLYINGTDLNALGGYLHLKMDGKKILDRELVR